MKKEVMEKWVEALRSGEYKQARGALKVGDGFCCLGVLCEISEVSKFDDAGCYLMNYMVLPTAIQQWSGMKSNEGKMGSIDMFLTNLNDSERKSFVEIADIIETNWEKL